MLLMLTNSIDATSDEVTRRVGPDRTFRFNLDLWREYEIRIDQNGFTLEDPSGRRCENTAIRALYLRKPEFNDPIDVPAGGCEEAWLREQVKTLLQEIYNWCRDAGLVRLVEKNAQGRFGKFNQLWLAKKHFAVPEWMYVRSSRNISFPYPAITKAITAEYVTNYRMLLTTTVNVDCLDRSMPWMVQRQIDAIADITVVYVAGSSYAFQLDRSAFSGVDWRRHIYTQDLPWRRIHLEPAINDAIVRFMTEAGLSFGRLDFLLQGQELFFLEVNPNGQWAWLDENGQEGIFDEVVAHLTKGWT